MFVDLFFFLSVFFCVCLVINFNFHHFLSNDWIDQQKKSNFHHFKYFFSWLSFFWLSNEKKEWKILFVWKDKLGNQKKNRIEFKNVILVVNLQSKSMFSSPPPYKQNNFRNQPKIKIKMKTGNRFFFHSFFGYQESKMIMIIGWLAGWRRRRRRRR